MSLEINKMSHCQSTRLSPSAGWKYFVAAKTKEEVLEAISFAKKKTALFLLGGGAIYW